MEGVRRIARAYYDRSSEDEKELAREFFRELDSNGDGKISLEEYKNSVSKWLSDEKIFKQLDSNNDGALNFSESLALYYVKKLAIPTFSCNACRAVIIGPYFSCNLCTSEWPQTYDLCIDCYQGGKFEHEHPSSNFVDDQSLLVKFISKTQKKETELEELCGIARSHYRAGSPEVQKLAKEFFNSMDSDGDGYVDLPEFLAFMRQEGYTHMRNLDFFKELDMDGNGRLDFWEVMTLYYIIKSGRPFCDWCGKFIPGIFFACVECFKGRGSSFNLCRQCYRSTECNHNHNGRTQFLDNYTLLETKRDSALAQAAGVNNNSEPSNSQATSPVPPKAIVPARGTKMDKFQAAQFALKALDVAIAIGSISTTMCTIL